METADSRQATIPPPLGILQALGQEDGVFATKGLDHWTNVFLLGG